jgi:hypothetical protein
MSWTQVKHDEHIRQWTRDMSSKANTEFQKCKRIWYDDGVTQYGKQMLYFYEATFSTK